jgi:RNA-directed DNA polymerase
LKLIQQMLKAGYEEKGQRYETPRGTPQGGVVTPPTIWQNCPLTCL